jgi:Ca-activated chloride channel family protein
VSFANPGWLWWLLALPPLLLLEWRSVRRADRALERLVGSRLHHVLLGQRRPGHRRLGIALRASAFALLVLGASGPEWGRELVRRNAVGSDVVLLMDVSASMDVRDVPPSRIEEARREALAVVDRLSGSRLGVVAFAGDAVRLCPLTLDRGAVRLVLESITSSVVSEPGTDVGRGLRSAARMLPGGRRTEQVIVLWTDGEDLEKGAGDAIEELARSGFRVLAVGVGTPAGDVVPALDELGRAVDVKRDEAGGPVRSRLDEDLLRKLARETRGAYFAASRPGGELPRLLAALGSVSQGERGQRLVEQAVPRFPWCAGLAVLLLALELGRAQRRRNDATPARAGQRNGASGAGVPASAAPAAQRPEARGGTGSGDRRAAERTAQRVAGVVVLLLSLGLAGPARAETDWARGDRALRKGRFAQAESLYARRAGRDGPAAVQVNRATAGALAGRGARAESLLASLTDAAGKAGPTAAYNLGTLEARDRRLDEAVATLRRSLEREPDDADARFNYELALRRQRERQRSSSNSPNPSPSNPRPQGQGKNPSTGSPPPNPPPNAPPAPSPEPQISPLPGPRGMDRRTAEQLLGSLSELERIEQQRLRKVRVVRERRGKDW